MSVEELAFHKTPLGELTLRRRTEMRLGGEVVFEVKLGDEYLMSSLFTEGERRLAELGLAGLQGELEVVVGGLGLGYTAAAALENRMVKHLLVIELFQEVIDWHCNGLVPLGAVLSGDDRCELRRGDFFELAKTGLDAMDRTRTFDAILLDVDHSPEHFLDENNRSFYSANGLRSIRDQLKTGGSFALWSNDPPDEGFSQLLRSVFGEAVGHAVEFQNPYTLAFSNNSVYVARNFPL